MSSSRALRQPVERLAQVLADDAADLAGVRDHACRACRTASSHFARGLRARPCRRRACCRPRRRSASGSRRSAPAARRTSPARPRRRASRCVIVLISVTRSSTSCARSLSPVEMTRVACPRACACTASVPITSSASTPSTISSGQPMRAHDLVHRLDLQREVVGHRGAVRLVLGIQVVAERLALGVEHAGDVVRLVRRSRSRRSMLSTPRMRAGRLAASSCAGRAARGTRDTGTTNRRPAAERFQACPDTTRTDKIPEADRPARALHDQRAGSVAGARDYGRVRDGDRAPARHPSRGVSMFGSARMKAGHAVLRNSPRTSRAAVRRGLLRDLRRRSRPHAGGQQGRARGQRASPIGLNIVLPRRAVRQPLSGHLPDFRYFFARKMMFVRVRVRVRRAARRLRHARRAVRSADARADRQDPAHADHPGRHEPFWRGLLDWMRERLAAKA